MTGELVFITGGTGFIGFAVILEALKAGYRVRISVRRAAQAEQLKSHNLIVPFASKFEYVVVPDMTISGAFDDALEGVSYIEHVATPVPSPVSPSTSPGLDY
jgi:nucleoside-diphosphate-sugar epimerase